MEENMAVNVQCLVKNIFSLKVSWQTDWLQSSGGWRTPIWNRRGCSSEILNLTPKGDQSGRGLSKF